MPKFTSAQLEALENAIDDAYPTKDEFKNMLGYNIRYDHLVGEGLNTKIHSLVEKAKAEDWILGLIEQARKHNPTNELLKSIENELRQTLNDSEKSSSDPQWGYSSNTLVKDFPENIDCTIFYKQKADTQFYTFSPLERKTIPVKLIPQNIKNKTPFIGLAPYSIENSSLFFRKGLETDYIINKIAEENKNIVIASKRFTGKTSLINSAIIPQLLKTESVEVFIVKFENYQNFIADLTKVIQILPSNKTDSFKTFLILDQFEDFFDSIVIEKQFGTLTEIFKQLLEKCNLIISCQNDDTIRKISRLNNETGDQILSEELIDLSDFDKRTALEIITKLLITQDNNIWDQTVINGLVEDCSKLGNDNKISPLLIQVVCSKMQQQLELTSPRERNSIFYEKNNAAHLLFLHLEGLIKGKLSSIGADATKILAYLSTIDNQVGVTLEELVDAISGELQLTKNLISSSVADVLESLQKQRLILKKRESGKVKYFLVFLLYGKHAKKLLEDPKINNLLVVKQDFHIASLLWNEHVELIEKGRIERFFTYKEDLTLNPLKLLLLLRSSIEEGKQIDFWYENLFSEEGIKFVKEIQDSQTKLTDDQQSAIKLFYEPTNSARTPQVDNKITDNSWLKKQAVLSDKLEIRQTAIIVLTISEGEEFNLDNIVQPELLTNPLQRLFKRGELVGTLLDYLPSQRKNFGFTLIDRLFSWGWRVSRRVQSNSFSFFDLIIALIFIVLGGLIYGISRRQSHDLNFPDFILFVGFTSIIIMPLMEFFILLFMFGTKFSQIRPLENEKVEKDKVQTISDVLLIVAGALSFGFINLVSNLLEIGFSSISKDGWITTILWIFLGIIAGGGIGLGLKFQRLFSKKSNLIGFLFGGTITIIFFSLVQFFYGVLNSQLQLVSSSSEIDALFAGFSFYLGLFWAALKGNLFDENPNNSLIEPVCSLTKNRFY